MRGIFPLFKRRWPDYPQEHVKVSDVDAGGVDDACKPTPEPRSVLDLKAPDLSDIDDYPVQRLPKRSKFRPRTAIQRHKESAKGDWEIFKETNLGRYIVVEIQNTKTMQRHVEILKK